ncbi:MAG: hypothetical protein Q9227_007929 [Pyrenula ochraceoflavens]
MSSSIIHARHPRRTTTHLTLPHQTSSKTHKYDKDSGIVYTESLVTATPTSLDWTGNYATPSLVKPRLPHACGAASLLNTAKAVLARHMRWLTTEHLEAIPWIIGAQLWDEIVASRTESFHAWRVFATAYPEEFAVDSTKRFFMKIPAPGLPMGDYYAGLNASSSILGSTAYLVALRIAPKATSVADLVALAKIKNLAVLELTDPPPGLIPEESRSMFDERIMRAWAEMAVESRQGRAFRELRVLLLGRQHEVSGRWLFKYLQRFPKLGRIVLTDCEGLHQRNRAEWEELGKEHGWRARSAKKSVKRMRRVIDPWSVVCEEKSDQHQDGETEKDKEVGGHFGCISRAMDVDAEEEPLFTGQLSAKEEKKPLVECWLGQPRPWSHIVDDFPGTRTVWLDRLATSPTTAPEQKPIHAVTPTTTTTADEQTLTDRSKRAREHNLNGTVSPGQSPRRAKKPTPAQANESPATSAALGPRMKKRLAPGKGVRLEDVLRGFG